MDDFIPLARAAALAHGRLFPETVMDMKALDLIALALSALIPLYRRDGEALSAVAESDLARGRFTRGAARLEFPDRAPLRFLGVSRRELEGALEAVARDSLLAATLSRPRPPACSSAPGA